MSTPGKGWVKAKAIYAFYRVGTVALADGDVRFKGQHLDGPSYKPPAFFQPDVDCDGRRVMKVRRRILQLRL